MSVYAISFSPTGGTKRVLSLLTGIHHPSAEEVDLTAPETDYSHYHFTADDLCFVAVPVYAGRVPEAALQRLSAMQAAQTPTVAITVYGNRAVDDALLELRDTLTQCGFSVFAGVAAVAEHSILRQFGANRPDEQDAQELRAFADQIEQAPRNAAPVFPGKTPYVPRSAPSMIPTADDNCIACCTCAEHCPVQAIPMSDPATTDAALCIGCMRCVQICPTGARQVDSTALAALKAHLAPIWESRQPNQLFI